MGPLVYMRTECCSPFLLEEFNCFVMRMHISKFLRNCSNRFRNRCSGNRARAYIVIPVLLIMLFFIFSSEQSGRISPQRSSNKISNDATSLVPGSFSAYFPIGYEGISKGDCLAESVKTDIPMWDHVLGDYTCPDCGLYESTRKLTKFRSFLVHGTYMDQDWSPFASYPLNRFV
jgi:hypothetical protein